MPRSRRIRCKALVWWLCLPAALLVVLSACSVRQGLQVSVAPTPASHAWWLRSTFNATGTEVRGIPARRLAPEWCNADAFNTHAFPPALRGGSDGLHAGLKATSGGFSLRGVYGQRTLDVVLGAYRSCAGQRGDFLLVLDAAKAANDPQRIVQVEVLSTEPVFLYLAPASTPDAIRVVSCFECDHIGEWRWNDAGQKFVMQPEPEFGD